MKVGVLVLVGVRVLVGVAVEVPVGVLVGVGPLKVKTRRGAKPAVPSLEV